MNSMRPLALAFIFAGAAGGALPVQAAQRLRLWDLALGAKAAELPTGFARFACGSNGGPPLRKISGWTDVGQCDAEADGLREVAVEYDDSAERAALAAGRWLPLADIGTLEDFFPVIASALFDDTGVLVGVRLVTDPRPDQRPDNGLPRPRPRGEHYLLALSLAGRFGITESDCRDQPPARGETPVIGQFVKRECMREDEAAGLRYTIVAHYFRKPGQHDVDPATGQMTEGAFESLTRAEVWLVR